jgi:beta-galactosidase
MVEGRFGNNDIMRPKSSFVMMWSIGNEIVERGSHKAIEIVRMLASAVKKIDTTRPITSAVVMNNKD